MQITVKAGLLGLFTAERTTEAQSVPSGVQILGLFVMLLGELSSLVALGFDWSPGIVAVFAASGVVVGALFVAVSVAPTADTSTSAPAHEP